MIILTVLMWFLLALLLLTLLLLSLSIRYSIKASVQEEMYLQVWGSWAGLVSASFGLDQGARARAFGFPINVSGSKDKVVKEKKLHPTSSSKKKKKKDSKRDFQFPLSIRQTIRLVRQLLNYLRPQTLEVDMVIGFDDPYHTGLLSAVVSIMQWNAGKVVITPDFTEAVIRGRFFMEGRVRPLALVIIALRTFVPVFLEKIKTKFRRKREETTNVRI